jgi:hypothetical protein
LIARAGLAGTISRLVMALRERRRTAGHCERRDQPEPRDERAFESPATPLLGLALHLAGHCSLRAASSCVLYARTPSVRADGMSPARRQLPRSGEVCLVLVAHFTRTSPATVRRTQ